MVPPDNTQATGDVPATCRLSRPLYGPGINVGEMWGVIGATPWHLPWESRRLYDIFVTLPRCGTGKILPFGRASTAMVQCANTQRAGIPSPTTTTPLPSWF